MDICPVFDEPLPIYHFICNFKQSISTFLSQIYKIFGTASHAEVFIFCKPTQFASHTESRVSCANSQRKAARRGFLAESEFG